MDRNLVNSKLSRQEASPVHIHYHNHNYIKFFNPSPQDKQSAHKTPRAASANNKKEQSRKRSVNDRPK